MLKKDIVKIADIDLLKEKDLFEDVLEESLKYKKIMIDNKNVFLEKDGVKYEIESLHFAFITKDGFEVAYKTALPQLMEKAIKAVKLFKWDDLFFENTLLKDNIKEKNEKAINDILTFIKEIDCLMNPILDNLPIKIKCKEEFLKNFESVLENNPYFLDILNKFTIVYLLEQEKYLTSELKQKTIDEFVNLGILNEKDKIDLDYYEDFTPEELEKLFNTNKFEDEDVVSIVTQCFAKVRIMEKFKNNSKEKFNRKIIKIVNLLNNDEILDILSCGLLNKEEVEKTKITKRDLLNKGYELMLYFLENGDKLLPNSLKITSKDLINEYGRNIFGFELSKLVQYGYIEPQDLIEVYEKNKVLKYTEDADVLFTDIKVKNYYEPEILIDMKENNKLSPKFLKSYLELIDVENYRDSFKAYSSILIETLVKLKPENFEKDVLEFLDLGLCDVSIASKYITKDYIEQLFINNEISIEKVFEYYQKGLINDDAITSYYSPKEILKLYQNGKISGKCLTVIKNQNLLMDSFIDDKIAPEDFISLYFKGNISVENLDDAITISEKDVDISNFIDKNVSFSKIKELFSKYLIDYASILKLHNDEIINDMEFEEIKNAVNTREFFKALNDGKKYKVVTNRENTSKPSGHKHKTIIKDKNEFLPEIELISSLLEKDVENEPYSQIESYNVSGNPTSLNNYRIFGNEDLDGIVILQKSKKGNAVFVMSALQMMYFLKGKENSEGEIEIKDRMKDKAYLKTIEGVKVVEHSKNYARNLVEAVTAISPKISEKVKNENEQYFSEVSQMIEDMRKNYLYVKAKEKTLNDD